MESQFRVLQREAFSHNVLLKCVCLIASNTTHFRLEHNRGGVALRERDGGAEEGDRLDNHGHSLLLGVQLYF